MVTFTQLVVVCSLFVMTSQAAAAVVARIDRGDIELNESFTLEIISDENTTETPDVSALEADFYIGQSTTLSNTTIVNGQMERSVTWKYVLMPKRAGQLTIPPVRVGQESSNPVVVDVTEPSYAPPGEAEVFVTSEVDIDQTYVQAQVLLTIKIYRSVATRQPALREPTFSGVEYLMELVGDDRSYEAIIDGTPYGVIERVYAIYPQESGELSISSARFEARVLRAGRITGRKVYESEPQTVTVLPIPASPADYPDAAWLPARDVELNEDWSREPGEIKAGEPLTRHVTISALGQLETQIPALTPPSAAGVNVYPDKPDLARRLEPEGIRGVRKDQYAMIGTTPGVVTLPALELPWWNVDSGEWLIARLPERPISILPSGDAAMPPIAPDPDVASSAEADPTANQSLAFLSEGGVWRRVSELLAAIWLLTLFGWWWSSRPEKKPREPAPVPIHRQQAKHLKAARKAALASDGAGVRQAMLDWAALEWPDDKPRSVGTIASRVSAPLADALRELADSAYGPARRNWDGEALATAIRSITVVKNDAPPVADALPPLMPR